MKNLAHLAFKSEQTLGRALPVELDKDQKLYFMDPYELDVIKIQQSKAFRRLSGKTQVISQRHNVNIRDRLIHTMEIASASVLSACRLSANVSLCRAGALGHDVGHVTLGHLGEDFLAEISGENFRHEKFAIFVLEMVESLNLSYETLHVIRYHSRGSGDIILNGNAIEDDIVMICDKIYIISDCNDMKRIDRRFDIPQEMLELGNNRTERLDAYLQSFWKESLTKGRISFEDSNNIKKIKAVRDFMFGNVYHQLDYEECRQNGKKMLARLYDYFCHYFKNNQGLDASLSQRAAILAMALMSEPDAYFLNEALAHNKAVDFYLGNMKFCSLAEFLPRIPKLAQLDFYNPDRFLDKTNFGKLSKTECFAR